MHMWACFGLKLGHANIDSEFARTRISGDYCEYRRSAVEHGHRLLTQFRSCARNSLRRKFGNVNAGKEHGPNQKQISLRRYGGTEKYKESYKITMSDLN